MKKSKKPKIKGCNPVWYDGIFGFAWHCSCEDNDHGCDSQCSDIEGI